MKSVLVSIEIRTTTPAGVTSEVSTHVCESFAKARTALSDAGKILSGAGYKVVPVTRMDFVARKAKSAWNHIVEMTEVSYTARYTEGPSKLVVGKSYTVKS